MHELELLEGPATALELGCVIAVRRWCVATRGQWPALKKSVHKIISNFACFTFFPNAGM